MPSSAPLTDRQARVIAALLLSLPEQRTDGADRADGEWIPPDQRPQKKAGSRSTNDMPAQSPDSAEQSEGTAANTPDNELAVRRSNSAIRSYHDGSV